MNPRRHDKIRLFHYQLTIFFVGLFSAAAKANSQPAETITFFFDASESSIDLEGQDCIPLIDDDSNFELIKKDNTLHIHSTGKTGRSATLLIECNTASKVYTLRYMPRLASNMDDSDNANAGGQKTAVGASFQSTNNGSLSNYFLSDRSLEQIQINTFNASTKTRITSSNRTGFEISHGSMDTQLLLTGNKSETKSADLISQNETRSISISRSGFGISQTSGSIKNNAIKNEIDNQSTPKTQPNTSWSETRLTLPSPLSLEVERHKSSDGAELKSISRLFGAAIGRTYAAAFTKVSDTTYTNFETQDRINILRSDTSSRISHKIQNSLSLSANADIRCFGSEKVNIDNIRERSKGCGITTSSIETDLAQRPFDYHFEYALVPHALTVNAHTHLTNRTTYGAMVSRTLPNNRSPLRRWADVNTADETPATTHASFFSHIEFPRGPITFYLDHHHSLIPTNKFSSHCGVRFENRHWLVDTSVLQTTPAKNGLGFLVEITGFLDTNLRSLSSKLKTQHLNIEVLSNANGTPIHGQTVTAYGPSIGSQMSTTDINGVASFTGRFCCGEAVFATQTATGDKTEITISINDESEAAHRLILNDHHEITVIFSLDEGNTTELNNLSNHIAELNTQIVETPNAKYSNNIIYVPENVQFQPKVNPELLPFGYKVRDLKTIPNQIQSGEKRTSTLNVILTKK